MLEIESLKNLLKLISSNSELNKIVLKNLDLVPIKAKVLSQTFKKCILLGCKLDSQLLTHFQSGENYIFPQLDVPFNLYRKDLYNKDSLYSNYDVNNPNSYKKTFDYIVYEHFIQNGKRTESIEISLARHLHDHAMSDELNEFIANYPDTKIVAVMGGHQLLRSEPNYTLIAKTAKELTEQGFLMISGGGPGAMEATHVGAWFAGKTEKELKNAITHLAQAPSYKHPLWLQHAFQVIEGHPKTEFDSLGIPTWLYGHEPPTPFATKIAKFFENSMREEGLLAIAKGGVIYTPGSAGTFQEVFQDATQNHYLSFDIASPMIFVDSEFWTKKVPIYALLKDLMERGIYKNLLLSLVNERDEIISILKKFAEKNSQLV